MITVGNVTVTTRGELAAAHSAPDLARAIVSLRRYGLPARDVNVQILKAALTLKINALESGS